LRDAGIAPDFVCTTSTVRTQQTARLALAALGRAEQAIRPQRDGGFTSADGSFDAKIASWIEQAGAPPQTLMFVGHGRSQAGCRTVAPDLVLPKGTHGAVVVFEREGDGEWRVVRSFGGSGP
jgi:phosphohistidine phosphatase SixA